MTSVYLIRHAEAQGNLHQRFQGHTDTALTRHGYEQARQLALRMRAIPLAAVYASPLMRARETAAAVAKTHGLPVQPRPGLIEINGGEMENLPFKELGERYPEENRLLLEEPHKFSGVNGEPMTAVLARMREEVHALVRENKGRTIACVSHGAAIRAFHTYVSGIGLEKMNELPWCANTAVSFITFDDHLKPMLHYMSDDSHLRAEILSAHSHLQKEALP